MFFSPGGVFGGTLGGPPGVLGALLCLQGPPRAPQGGPPGPPSGPPGASWEPLEPPGSLKGSLWDSAKRNSEEGSERAFIFMVSLHIGIYLLETEHVR